MGRVATLFFSVAFGLAGCAAPQPPTPTSVAREQVPAGPAPAAPPGAAYPTALASPVRTHETPATGTPEDARRHVLRGLAAIESAKTKDDLGLAEDEFRAATEIAPTMSSGWFNLGKVQTLMGKFDRAMDSYRQYLALEPGAKDAQQVRDELVKLEFRQEQFLETQSRIGTWVSDNATFYELTLDGDRMTLKTDRRSVLGQVTENYTLVRNIPVNSTTTAQYQLVLRGNRLTGAWTRGPVRADQCTVPPDTGEVTGELSDAGHEMVLEYDFMAFQAEVRMGLITDDSCGAVTALGRRKAKEVLYGPLGKGGVGARLVGFELYGLTPDSPAYAAGLRNGDQVLAIDGVATKDLTAGQLIMRLRDEPGTSVQLEAWQKGQQGTKLVTLKRFADPLMLAGN